MFVKGADDARPEELYFEAEGFTLGQMIPTHFSRDGQHLLFNVAVSGTALDLWDLPTDSRQPRPILQTAFDEYQGALSPDGLWLAYVSEETGAPQVYVQSFPNGEQRVQVSSHGGTEPRWREDGRELFFLGADRMMMAVPISLQRMFEAKTPQPLFQTRVPILGNPFRWHYAVSGGGERFLVNAAPASVRTPAFHVVLDWRALLNRE